MYISLNWIKEFVDLSNITVDELVKRFGLSTAEVEGVEYKGKEIENYLPKPAIESMLGVTIQNRCEQYQLFPDYISPYYKSFSNKKVPFANQIKGFITSDNSIGILDLKQQIETLYEQIQKWNC